MRENVGSIIELLTKKEIEAMESLVICGCVKSAAKKMNISPRTLEVHVNHIKEKLNISYKHQINQIVIENFYTRKATIRYS